MPQVTLKIDVSAGTIEIQADDESFDRTVQKAIEIVNAFSSSASAAKSAQPTNSQTMDGENNDTKTETGNERTKKRTKSSTRSNYVIVRELLTAEQREIVRTAVQNKDPLTQNELVAVVCVKLKEILGRQEFTHDEVHTGIQAAGKRTPANLAAVFGNMSKENLGDTKEGRFIPSFRCDDLVNHDLPRAKKVAKD